MCSASRMPTLCSESDLRPALSFSEGSIGGDIEKVNLNQLEAFYGKGPVSQLQEQPDPGEPEEPRGSNGIAIGPANTKNHHALLLINPHTSFFFRSELQMVSQEGLNAYGASTWGQFFLYQGFNDKVGWMHTSSGVDAIDEYLETVEKKDGRWMYKFGSEMRPVTVSEIAVPYKAGNKLAEKKFTIYRTQHGPVVRQQGAKWASFRSLPSLAILSMVRAIASSRSLDGLIWINLIDADPAHDCIGSNIEHLSGSA